MQCSSRPPPLLPVSLFFLLLHQCHVCGLFFVLVIRLRVSYGSSCIHLGFPVLKSSFDYTYVVSPSSRLHIPFSRLLTVVAMSFLSAIFASVLQLRLQHLGSC